MKTIRTRAGEALSDQEKEIFSGISEKIGRRFRRTVLIWLGITVWFAVLLGVLTYFRSRISPLFTVSFVIAAGIFWLWIMVSITEQKWDDGLPPAPTPDGAQRLMDEACRKEQQALKNERGTLLIAGFFLIAFSPIFLLLAVLRAYFAKERPGTAHCAAEYYAAHLARVINTAALAVVPLALTGMMLPMLWQHFGYSKVSSLNMAARGILHAAAHYQSDLDMEERPLLKTTVVAPGEPCERGTLQYGMSVYYPELRTEKLWYAIVVDEEGGITEAYCSYSPLTEADLVPTDFEAQYKIASSLLHSREVIGYGSEKQHAE